MEEREQDSGAEEPRAFRMDLPPPPTDEEVARIARKLGAPIPSANAREDVERA